MKTRNFIVRSGALLLLSTLIYQLSTCPARAQGTAFLYQGREVNLTGQPINNLGANLKFNLYHRQGIPPDSYSDSLFGTITTNSVSIVNGLFSLELDFGAAAFDGSDCWLEVQGKVQGEVQGEDQQEVQQEDQAERDRVLYGETYLLIFA